MKPTFWLLTLLFTLATLSLVLKPLWPQARGTLAMSLLLLSLAAAALYTLVGTPQALQPAQIATPQTLDAAIAQLRDTLHQHPERIEGWMLLGHALRQQQRFGEAQKAFTEAARRAPNNPDILMATAEIRMHMAPNQRLDAEAIGLLKHVLILQPRHQRARWFLGMAYRQVGDAAAAVATWEPLLSVVDTATAHSLREQIALARHDAHVAAQPHQSHPHQ